MRYFGLACGLLVLLYAGCVLFAGVRPTADRAIVPNLVFGWWMFLKGVLPLVTASWDGAVSGIVFLGLFMVGSHLFFSWLYGAADRKTDRRWAPRWTFGITSMIVLLFAIGICFISVVHQVTWTIASEDPMYLEASGFWSAYRPAREGDLTSVCGDLWERTGGQDMTAARASAATRGERWMESLHALFLDGEDGRLAAVVVFPRDPKERQELGFAMATADGVEKMSLEGFVAVVALFPSGRSLDLDRFGYARGAARVNSASSGKMGGG